MYKKKLKKEERKVINKMLRDFIYMDKDRLNSLYSQVFKGVIEAVVESYSDELKNNSEVKRNFIGQSIESQVAEASTKIESKILYDHMYNSLENKLNDIIFNVNKKNNISLNELTNKTIIKVTGKAVIQDYKRLELYLEKINELGKIVAYSDYMALSKTQQKATNVNRLAKEAGLEQDKTLLNNLKFITDFFNKDEFDVLISSNNSRNILYQGIINKDYLRISPGMLRLLYGDEPSMEWSMVGQITQVPQINNGNNVEKEFLSIIDAYQAIFESYRNVEKIFFQGIEKQRIHIAPIAIYTETPYSDSE